MMTVVCTEMQLLMVVRLPLLPVLEHSLRKARLLLLWLPRLSHEAVKWI